MTTEFSPRIYVASLADYDAGRLHGRWIDANQDVDVLWDEVAGMLRASTEPIAEEFAIHDFDDFGPVALSEYESLATVRLIATGLVAHGRAFGHWVNHIGMSELSADADEQFEEAFLGHAPSMTAFAEQLIEEYGWDELLETLPESVRRYTRIDIELFARDLRIELSVSEDEDGVYVFNPS